MALRMRALLMHCRTQSGSIAALLLNFIPLHYVKGAILDSTSVLWRLSGVQTETWQGSRDWPRAAKYVRPGLRGPCLNSVPCSTCLTRLGVNWLPPLLRPEQPPLGPDKARGMFV
jgi:hypothetical protein